MTSQTSQQTIEIKYLPNISKRKGNQKLKSSQLVKYNMKNILLGKSFTKCGGETITRPFSKKSKLRISLNKQAKVICSLLTLYAKLRVVKIY